MANSLPGMRFAALLGGRVSRRLSLNGELTIDENSFGGNAGNGTFTVTDVYEQYVHLAFSPLAHFGPERLELVLGPKFGMFRSIATRSGPTASETNTLSGIVAGLNAGVFGRVGNTVALGGLLSIEVRDGKTRCDSAPGQAETCTSGDATRDVFLHTARVFAASVSALF